MRKILALMLALQGQARADIVHVFTESGAFVAHANANCSKELRDTILAITRAKIRVDGQSAVLGGSLPADDLVATDYGVWAFWRSKSQTVVVAVRPKRGTDRRDVEISVIDRSGDQPCYEKWRGYAQ